MVQGEDLGIQAQGPETTRFLETLIIFYVYRIHLYYTGIYLETRLLKDWLWERLEHNAGAP